MLEVSGGGAGALGGGRAWAEGGRPLPLRAARVGGVAMKVLILTDFGTLRSGMVVEASAADADVAARCGIGVVIPHDGRKGPPRQEPEYEMHCNAGECPTGDGRVCAPCRDRR